MCMSCLRPHAGGGCGSFCGVCSFQNRSWTSYCQSLDDCSVSVVTLQTQTYRLGLIKSLHFSAKQSQETKYHKLEGAPIPTDFWQFCMNTGAELICRGCFRAPRWPALSRSTLLLVPLPITRQKSFELLLTEVGVAFYFICCPQCIYFWEKRGPTESQAGVPFFAVIHGSLDHVIWTCPAHTSCEWDIG